VSNLMTGRENMIKNFQSLISNLQSRWGWVMISGLAIIVLYFLLRLINLTLLPVFADEAIYIRWSQVMRAESTLRFLPLSDGKQPLFMWLLIPILSFFKDPLFAGRFLSVLCGLGTLLGIFGLSFYLFKSRRIALMASFLYAVVPFAVFFDRLALVDSLLGMFAVWVLFLGVLLIKYQRIDLAIITGLVLGGAFLTKSPAIFFALLLPSTAILLPKKKKKDFLVLLIKLVSLWFIVYAFAFGAYNILRLGPNFHMISLRNKDYVFSLKEVLSHPLDPFKPHIGQVWEWFWFFVSLPIIFTFIAGLVVGLRRFAKQTILLLIWFVVPLVVQMSLAKVFTARYIFFTIPFFLIVAAFGLNWLMVKIKTARYLLIGTLLVVILLPVFSFNYHLLTNPQKLSLPGGERSGYLELWTSGYGINEVRDYIKKLSKEKQIIVGTEGYFGTLPDGLQIYFDKDPKVTILGVGLALNKIPEQLVDSASKGNPTYLVVNKSRMGAKDDPGLKLILEIPKAIGEKGQDSLLFYQVK